MKTKNIILLASLFLIGNQGICSQSNTGNLPIIDFSKNYPQKEIRLQDIADIEYIPLETTDDILLSDEAKLSYVSDKYILVHEPRKGDIFLFNRNGKIHSHFNHRGQSGQEYLWLGGGGTIMDEKAGEIYVCSQVIQVYSLGGEYKRTLKINTIENEVDVFDFDDEALLIYCDVNVDPYIKSNTKERPYCLISKKDGSLISVLDIYLPKRYSTRMHKTLENNMYTIVSLYMPYSLYYGGDFVIADISTDTLYMLNQNKLLTPLAVREPSVHTPAEPRIVWKTKLTTDKFIILDYITLDFSPTKGRRRNAELMYDFKNGEISRVTFLDDVGRRGRWFITSPAIAKNKTADMIQTQDIIDRYRLKHLKGDVAKLASTLDEEDNPVVRIIKFKQ